MLQESFRTALKTNVYPFQIGQGSRIVSVGSCFAGAIGNRLARYKLDVQVNPFGNIFNPLSAFKLLGTATENNFRMVENNGAWYCYDLHSEFWAASKEEISKNTFQTLRSVQSFLSTADVAIITLGTAWVYRLKETGETVANCHKMPATIFDKILLAPAEIIENFALLHKKLSAENPKLQFIFTVSPVRHIKDSLELNSVSKSILRYVCHVLQSRFENVHYFPAYELVLDDLRDYRFYKKDMVHPNEVAEDYIWGHFVHALAEKPFQDFMGVWDGILAAMQHKPFNIQSAAHQRFLKENIAKLQTLAGAIDVQNELIFFSKQLNENR